MSKQSVFSTHGRDYSFESEIKSIGLSKINHTKDKVPPVHNTASKQYTAIAGAVAPIAPPKTKMTHTQNA